MRQGQTRHEVSFKGGVKVINYKTCLDSMDEVEAAVGVGTGDTETDIVWITSATRLLKILEDCDEKTSGFAAVSYTGVPQNGLSEISEKTDIQPRVNLCELTLDVKDMSLSINVKGSAERVRLGVFDVLDDEDEDEDERLVSFNPLEVGKQYPWIVRAILNVLSDDEDKKDADGQLYALREVSEED